jgi:two-component system response regulator
VNDAIILLVEDNPDDADLAVLAFKESQLANEIVLAEDGVEAIDYLFGTGSYAGRDTSIMPQVILLDLKLPRMDGLEVLRRIREDGRTKLIPVVVLTSSDEETDIIRSYGNGANSYIRKPVGFPEFIEAVRTMGLYWLVLNRAPPLDRTL